MLTSLSTPLPAFLNLAMTTLARREMFMVSQKAGFELGVFDTLSDSIQYLNFAKKWFNQYSIQYCFTQDSIKKNLLIQFKR